MSTARYRIHRACGRAVGVGVFLFAALCAGVYIGRDRSDESRTPSAAIRDNIRTFDFVAATGVPMKDFAGCVIGDDPVDIVRHCSFGEQGASRRFLILGDSHVGAWYPAFEVAAVRRHYAGIMAKLPGCPPLFGIASWDGDRNACFHGFDANIARLLSSVHFDQVFLVARWNIYSEGHYRRGELRRPSHFISDASRRSDSPDSSKAVIRDAFAWTIDLFRGLGIRVIVVHSVPGLPEAVQDLPPRFALPAEEYLRQRRFMNGLVEEQSVSSIDPGVVLCATGACVTWLDHRVLYDDDNHITPAAAARLIGLIVPELDRRTDPNL